MTNWLKVHSSVETVSRDRSSTYASGITQASNKIIQIADRWHILKNLTEGFERFLNTQRGSLSDISVELSQQQHESENIVPVPLIIAKKDTSITGRYYDNLRIVAPSKSKGVTK